jgi:hypothetical protein
MLTTTDTSMVQQQMNALPLRCAIAAPLLQSTSPNGSAAHFVRLIPTFRFGIILRAGDR